jgi:hypothetical protein
MSEKRQGRDSKSTGPEVRDDCRHGFRLLRGIYRINKIAKYRAGKRAEFPIGNFCPLNARGRRLIVIAASAHTMPDSRNSGSDM